MTAVPAGPGVSSPPDSWVRMSMARADGDQFDGQDTAQVLHRLPELAGGVPAHGHVVLLHGGARDGVHGGRDGEPLVVGDQPCLRVLRNHQAGIHTGIRRQEGRQPV